MGKKKIECIICSKKIKDSDIDKTRTEYKINPLCKKCSDELFIVFNGS